MKLLCAYGIRLLVKKLLYMILQVEKLLKELTMIAKAIMGEMLIIFFPKVEEERR